MKKFLILLREDLSAVNQMTPEQMEADIAAYMQWVEGLKKEDRHIMSDPLETSGAMVSKNKVETDGPFIESKEAISGFFLIRAKDLDEAIAVTGCSFCETNGTGAKRPPDSEPVLLHAARQNLHGDGRHPNGHYLFPAGN